MIMSHHVLSVGILSSITLFLALRKMYFHIPQNSQLLQTHPQMIIQPLIDLAPVLEAEHKLYVLHLLYKYYT